MPHNFAIRDKIVNQLTEDEKSEEYGFEGDFDGFIYTPEGDKEIYFCEKCLTRITNTEEIFCFDSVYLCENCRKESAKS